LRLRSIVFVCNVDDIVYYKRKFTYYCTGICKVDGVSSETELEAALVARWRQR